MPVQGKGSDSRVSVTFFLTVMHVLDHVSIARTSPKKRDGQKRSVTLRSDRGTLLGQAIAGA